MSSHAFRLLTFAAFRAELNELDRAIAEVLSESSMAARFARTTKELDLSPVCVGDAPSGDAHAKRVVLFEPSLRSDTTVFVANIEDGWLTMVNCLAGKLVGSHVHVCTSGTGVEYPLHSFELWKGGNSLRTVQAMRDEDRWEFFERGPIQSFEDPENYQRRSKKERLTREILAVYLRRLEWDFEDPDFWRSSVPALYYDEQKS